MEQLGVKKLRFPIIVEVDEDEYYVVSYPLFKGCHSYGETIEETLENINGENKEVIKWLAVAMCLAMVGMAVMPLTVGDVGVALMVYGA